MLTPTSEFIPSPFGNHMTALRESVKDFYKSRNIGCELHYVDISDETWEYRLHKRNNAVLASETSAYYVDDNLAAKFASIFEVPSEDEIDVVV